MRSSAGVGTTRFITIAIDGALLEDSALLKRIRVGEQLDIHVDHVGWVPAFLSDHTPAGARLEFIADGAMHARWTRHFFAQSSGMADRHPPHALN